MEKENIFELSIAHSDPQEEQLNRNILVLYDRIEAATIENLEIAKKNSELEVQINTLKDVLATGTPQKLSSLELYSQAPPCLQEQYDSLASQHFQLANRVSLIQEILGSAEEKTRSSSKRGPPSLQKVSSIGVIGTQRRACNRFEEQPLTMVTSIKKIVQTKRKRCS